MFITDWKLFNGFLDTSLVPGVRSCALAELSEFGGGLVCSLVLHDYTCVIAIWKLVHFRLSLTCYRLESFGKAILSFAKVRLWLALNFITCHGAFKL